MPATVAADALPTVQQNGVVWSSVTVGNTVYATGSFTETWPAGTSNTAANWTPRNNLLAFDITTGALIPSFNHSLNAQGITITASPDGSRLYVGGDFTAVDGQTRNHIAAFDTATGALSSTFRPSLSAQVAALTASNTVVYAGGSFLNSAGVPRSRLAAFTAAGGTLLPWAPKADDNLVAALVLSPDQTRVVIGGRFTTLNGVPAYGLGSVSIATGATLPFPINQTVRDYGTKCGILSLSTDGHQIYGSGFAFGCGNFEGTFATDPAGNLAWVNDCHGDTYGTYPVGSVLYSVSHAHDCTMVGSFPDYDPRIWHHALAETSYPTGVNNGPDSYGWNYRGVPDATVLHWFPALGIGSYTQQYQAAWTVSGNAQYLVLGGEFPTVNGVAQQGLVRFAISSIAPNKVSPLANPTALTPTAASPGAGSVRLSWQSTWDYDNQNLTYRVFRDGAATAVFSTAAKSTFWQTASMSFLDVGLAPGSSHSYRIRAYDSFGNTVSGNPVSVTVSGSGTVSTYQQTILADGANRYWRLGETAGSTGLDSAGAANLTEGAGVGHGAAGAIAGDTNPASTFNGTSTGWASTTQPIPGPNTFSLEAWFKTTSTSGGKLIGFGNSASGATSSNYDRQLYLDNAGHVSFGVYNANTFTVTSANAYNNGQWHHVVATLSGAGLALYLDGAKVGANANATIGQAYSGYWRIGGDNLNGWPGTISSSYLQATLDEVAVYPAALTPAQVQNHYVVGGG